MQVKLSRARCSLIIKSLNELKLTKLNMEPLSLKSCLPKLVERGGLGWG